MVRILAIALVLWEVSAASVRSEEPRPPVQTERSWAVYRVDNLRAADVANVVSHLLKSEQLPVAKLNTDGNPEPIVLADAATNSLVVSAPPEAMERIKSLIKSLDVVPPAVRIEVIMIELPARANSSSAKNSEAGSLSADQLRKELGLDQPGASADPKEVQTRVAALEQAGRLRAVRRPQVLTLNNHSAQLQLGRNEPMVTSTSQSKFGQQNSITYREVGLILTVTPRVSSDNVVTAEISLTESRLGPSEEGVTVAEYEKETLRTPQVMHTETQSVVRLRDGRTVVLSGLSNKGQKGEPEQLILVTAHVMRN